MLIGEKDEEMLRLLRDEIECLQNEIKSIKEEIVTLLYPEDKPTKEDIILEVNAGVGGQEAMLFTNEMFSMYMKYINYKNWTMKLINVDQSNLGGIRHATVSVSGVNVFKRMMFEAGVHRVQRSPLTDKTGRLHTSTMTVAAFLQPNEIEVVLNPKDLKIETCKSSGKGGQHVNTTDSAVRIIHLPTGISAECQNERSQLLNKETAMKLLRTKIFEKQNESIQNEITDKRKMQVGRANRNEKIRTYNFKDDRISDHRINHNVFGIQTFFEGREKLDALIDILVLASKEQYILTKIKELLKQ
ncbi:hypothetical protein HELRODRAFT_62992 [Helobdella robusta]|uniref:Peptide chain release factor domain-containing protein n=1 Tax=Helobdella robusta TaxID=6412 RepID=T1FX91_HELRO|nr:hypothetical protein HELRODRAFT_62992 [Helobdella robusta]ESO12415.1 hypothetical protein HELRODRAFT_62992 [Helobdella robusta]